MATIVEKMWSQRTHNPYWIKLHEHIDDVSIESWCEDHDKILEALIRKDPYASKLAMWQHLENTKQMLFRATTDDFEFNVDRYLFTENPVVHLDNLMNNSKVPVSSKINPYLMMGNQGGETRIILSLPV